MSIKFSAALYSSILATLALAWAITAHFRDSSRKLVFTFILRYQTLSRRIEALPGECYQVFPDLQVTEIQGSVLDAKSSFKLPHVGGKNGDLVLTISVINAGRLPLSVRRWGIVKAWSLIDLFFSVPDHWELFEPPPKVEESATVEFEVRGLSAFGLEELAKRKKKLVIEDTRGKMWGLSKRQLRSLSLAVRKYKEDLSRSEEFVGVRPEIYSKEELFGSND